MLVDAAELNLVLVLLGIENGQGVSIDNTFFIQGTTFASADTSM